MKGIICTDDRGGMAFNQRRQSRDRAVQENIIALIQREPLFIEEYSAPLFETLRPENMIVGEIPLDQKEGYCFMEKRIPAEIQHRIDTLVLYRWNRIYPSDVLCPFDLTDGTWELTERMDFQGHSHDKITREIYRKADRK